MFVYRGAKVIWNQGENCEMLFNGYC